MKKLLMTLSIIAICSNVVISQVSEIFGLNDTGVEYIECYILLHQQGVYEIMLKKQEITDSFTLFEISYGTYKIVNGNLYLVDLYNNCKMQFYYNGNSITSKKTFKGLMNKIFVKKNYGIVEQPLYTRVKINHLNLERQEFNKLNKERNPFDFGLYEDECGFSLDLYPDKKYTYAYKKLILSEGEWNRVNNELTLYDSTIKDSFYVFIEKDNLISKFSPFRLNTCHLKKIKSYKRDHTLLISIIGAIVTILLYLRIKIKNSNRNGEVYKF